MLPLAVGRESGPVSAVVVIDPGVGGETDWGRVRAMLGRRGRVFVVAGASRAVALLPELSRAGLEPKELLLASGSATAAPGDALVVAACAKRGGLVVRSIDVGAHEVGGQSGDGTEGSGPSGVAGWGASVRREGEAD